MTATSGGSASGSRIVKGYEQFVAEALDEIEEWSTAEAIERYGDDDVVFVDVRDAQELVEHGRIPGAVHASRGMLEFHVDPESPYFIEVFGEDRLFAFHCAAGARSALAAHRAGEMGLASVVNVEGGFTAWKEAGGPVEEPSPTM
jgi:rhodanese-related sulfurtransferase